MRPIQLSMASMSTRLDWLVLYEVEGDAAVLQLSLRLDVAAVLRRELDAVFARNREDVVVVAARDPVSPVLGARRLKSFESRPHLSTTSGVLAVVAHPCVVEPEAPALHVAVRPVPV